MDETREFVSSACQKYRNESGRMIDILWEVQNRLGWISPESLDIIAQRTQTHRVEVEGVASFYAFFKDTPQGKHIIHLCEDIVDQHAGMQDVLDSLLETLGIQPGQTTSDGLFSLHLVPCIGMSDQAPAALIGDQVYTKLSPSKIKSIIKHYRKSEGPATSQVGFFKTGDGANAHPLVRAMVRNNIRQPGAALFGDHSPNVGLRKALSLSPHAVTQQVLESELRGRGGAGFSAAKKWQVAAQTEASSRYIICNADEGEPGTFKDRVLLTECPQLLIEGMTIAAYAAGANRGIIYLRAEYQYLRAYLESILQAQREQGFLGKDILIDESDDTSFSFDIRIQLGAGAYICGEESALIRSCEGKRGEPANKPPYPTQVGYRGLPTVVNNVETYCNLPLVMERGAKWFKTLGTSQSHGTKVLSVCGDCRRPGIYEVEMGLPLSDLLSMCGATDPQAVQVGGASGQLIGKAEFDRRLCFEDLPSAGAIIIFNGQRNILDIVNYYMKFFIDESCGYCTPCRVGNVFMQQCLEKIMKGQGEASDLDYLQQLGNTVRETSRCGLGHTSPNPILSSMKHFPLVYSALLKEHRDGSQAGFDIQSALNESRIIAKRRSLVYDPDFERGKEV